MQEKVEVPFDAFLKETLSAMTNLGLLLVTQGTSGVPNAMAIGWGSIGSIWGQPVFTVLVRPSRYTYKLLEQNGDFTVNVLPAELGEAVDLCGRETGADMDKFAAAKLTASPGLQAGAPIITQSIIAYECRTLMTNEVVPDRLDREIRESAYASGNFHRLYFGKILCTRAARGLAAG